MLRNNVSRVVVVDLDDAHRDALTRTLRHAGYVVEATGDTMCALDVVHKSAHPLIVLLAGACLQVLNVAAADRRLADWHAYIVLAAEESEQMTDCECWYSHLKLRVVRQPIDEPTLLEVVGQAARAVGLKPAV